ncbi:hypothetical protein GW932_00195 [archaeon]|nr:hypothetical protein [archaeon]
METKTSKIQTVILSDLIKKFEDIFSSLKKEGINISSKTRDSLLEEFESSKSLLQIKIVLLGKSTKNRQKELEEIEALIQKIIRAFGIIKDVKENNL